MEECVSKLGDIPENKDSVFQAIIDLFCYLPIAAVVKESILCVHSGISDGITLESLNTIKKPYNPENNKIIADILWSQPSIYKDDYPTSNYTSQYRKLNFNQESLNKFLTENKLSMIVRTKDFCQSGFEKIFNGKLLTIFSATNYLGTQQNDGAVLYIKRNLEMQPKINLFDESNVTWNNKKELLATYPLSPKKKVS